LIESANGVSMSKLIFGCGYLGRRVAKRWQQLGDAVHVVTRSDSHAAEFERDGFSVSVANVLQPHTLTRLPAVDSVLYAIGYDRASEASRHEVYVDGLRNVLDALPASTGKLIYVSSTGVYGQSHGEWVDESSPCEPVREGGKACLAAEQWLASHPLGQRAIVLRMAGLYGPGRIPNAAAIRAGEPIGVAEHGYLNLVHVDDAAQVIVQVDRQTRPPQAFVVSDGHPVERREYYRELARLLGLSPPTFVTPTADAATGSRSESSKRASNARLMAELSPTFAYPSYREGLAAIVAEEQAGKP
jgi:nucleoside-diphosphate-sugar epimerase